MSDAELDQLITEWVDKIWESNVAEVKTQEVPL